jgi:hypothetical protein
MDPATFPFVRIDASQRSLASFYDIASLPAVGLFRGGKYYPYDGVHTSKALKAFVAKQLQPAPASMLESLSDVKTFCENAAAGAGTEGVGVVAFFPDVDGMEDEREDFLGTAKALMGKHDILFGEVHSDKVASAYRKAKRIPSADVATVMLSRMSGKKRVTGKKGKGGKAVSSGEGHADELEYVIVFPSIFQLAQPSASD